MSSLPYTASGDTLTIFTDDVITITSSHPNFQRLLAALATPQASAEVPDLLDPVKAERAFTGGRIHTGSVPGRIRMAQTVLDAGYPRMVEALNAFLDAGRNTAWVDGLGDVVALLSNGNYFQSGHEWQVGVGRVAEYPKLNLDDPADKIVFEQIQSVVDAGDNWDFVTSYRTLTVAKARLPFLSSNENLVYGSLNRSIELPGVIFGIQFIRSIANA